MDTPSVLRLLGKSYIAGGFSMLIAGFVVQKCCEFLDHLTPAPQFKIIQIQLPKKLFPLNEAVNEETNESGQYED
jgi:hypothetical protein